MRVRFLGMAPFLSIVAIGLSGAGEGDKKLLSGPPAGTFLPGPFDCRLVNSCRARAQIKEMEAELGALKDTDDNKKRRGELKSQIEKVKGELTGRQHCLVCEHRLFPVVLVFVREPAGDLEEDGPILHLLSKLDGAMARHEASYLKAAGIFLSPDAQSSATREGKKDAKELVEEARLRDVLMAKLHRRADKLNHVELACFPAEGPAGYKIDPDAEVTIVFFNSLKVVASHAYPKGKMTKEDADRFVEEVDKTIKSWKRGADPKKGKTL